MAKPPGANGPSKSPRPVPEGDTAFDIDQLKKLGKYEIQKKIGAGGMGSVFLALDSGLKRNVALKVLPREKASNPTLVKRFKAEAQAAANLRHENIVMIYEAGEADGFLYIALEYVWGTDVADIVWKRGVMPVKRSLEIVRQMALALQHAHAQGIVHRDIKPANILVRRDGTAKLADMGLARAIDDHSDTSITRAGTTVGTVDYMSPEQARDSRAADFRSDVYSLGCTWYFMVTGEPPYPNGSMTNKLRAHAESPLPDPRSINPKVTEAVFAVMRRMTEKDPRRRYQTPEELLSDLESARVASDIVSEAILGDSDDEHMPPSRRKPDRDRSHPLVADSDQEEHPRARTADDTDEPAGPTWKPPREDRDQERQSSDLGRAIAFYALVIALVGGAIGGVGWMVQQFGSGVEGPTAGPAENPFVVEAVSTEPGIAGNPLQGNASIHGGAAPAVEDRNRTITGTPTNSGQSIEGQANVTRIGSEDGQSSGRVFGGSDSGTSKTTIAGAPTEGTPTAVGDANAAGRSEGGGANASSRPATKGGGRRTMSPAAVAAAEKRRTAEDALLPPWSLPASVPAEATRPTRFIVRRGAAEKGQFATLNDALDQVPPEGATIVLEGPGPFPLSPARIAGKARILIQSGLSASQPSLVVLASGEGRRPDGLLEFVDTPLELQDVHIAHSVAPDASDSTLIHMRGGSLRLNQCSMTVTGSGKKPVSAIRVSGSRAPAGASRNDPTRLLIDQSVIRGDNLTALAVDASELDAVVRRSLLWSGEAPAISVGKSAGKGATPRTLRFASTTVCSRTAAVQLIAPAPPTALEWTNSLLAAPAGSTSPVLCVLDGGTEDQLEALGRTITWKSTDTLYTGWKPLIGRAAGGEPVATDAGDWLRVWKDKAAGSAGQFQDAAWPAVAADEVVRAVQLDRLSPESIGKQVLKTADGGWPGCAPDLLNVASLAALDTPFAVAARPQIPVGMLDGPTAPEVIRVDLTKEDLGRVLMERKPASGTQIVAFGYGARQSSPIVIQDAWVRLKLEQIDGAPLVLSPKGIESGRPSEGNPQGDGLIVVQRGGLEITGGAFTIPASERTHIPHWFAHVIDGDLALRNCRVQGPLLASPRHKGLVRWQRAGGGPPLRPFTGSHDGYAVFDNCCLIGSGTIIEADLPRRAMFVRNSILVGRDDLMSISLRGGDGDLAAALDLETSTLSASGSILKVAAAALDGPAASPLAVFADRCVFGPPLPSGSQKAEPTLLSFSGPLMGTRQLAWYENRCGYAPDIAAFLRDDASRVEAQDFSGVWLKQWGPTHVVEPLTGPQGVVLNKDLPVRAEDRTKLEPADFTLYPSSRAATWDGGARPIGAPLSELQFPPIRAASSSPPTKTRPTKPASKSPSNRGGTKPAF